MGVEIKGLQETIQFLDELPKNIIARGYLNALQAGADIFKGAIEENAPVKEEDTGGLLDRGELRENVGIEIELDSNFRGGVATVGFYKRVANVPLWVEYGHNIVNRNNGKLIGEVPEHPFIRPAFDASAQAAIDAATDSLKKTVEGEYTQEAA